MDEKPIFEEGDLIGVTATDPLFGINLGRVLLKTHPESACADDETCCIHKPSDHPLNTAPQHWRADRGLMERICEHGIGHPDVDAIAYQRKTRGDEHADAQAIHGCDGCCRG